MRFKNRLLFFKGRPNRSNETSFIVSGLALERVNTKYHR
jgi:hypothetical protein